MPGAHGDIGAGTHGDAHLSLRQCGRVIDPISGHGDDVTLALQLNDGLRFALGQDSGFHIRDADLASYGLGCCGVVAGQHNHIHSRAAELADGGGGIRLDCIGHAHDSGKLSARGYEQHGLSGFAKLVGCGLGWFRNRHGVFGEQGFLAHDDRDAADFAGHALARVRLESESTPRRKVALSRFRHQR